MILMNKLLVNSSSKINLLLLFSVFTTTDAKLLIYGQNKLMQSTIQCKCATSCFIISSTYKLTFNLFVNLFMELIFITLLDKLSTIF
jgi:hypothetical protein